MNKDFYYKNTSISTKVYNNDKPIATIYYKGENDDWLKGGVESIVEKKLLNIYERFYIYDTFDKDYYKEFFNEIIHYGDIMADNEITDIVGNSIRIMTIYNPKDNIKYVVTKMNGIIIGID